MIPALLCLHIPAFLGCNQTHCGLQAQQNKATSRQTTPTDETHEKSMNDLAARTVCTGMQAGLLTATKSAVSPNTCTQQHDQQAGAMSIQLMRESFCRFPKQEWLQLLSCMWRSANAHADVLCVMPCTAVQYHTRTQIYMRGGDAFKTRGSSHTCNVLSCHNAIE